MQIQGMSAQVYNRLMDEIDDIRYLLVIDGQMATKTKVEDVLMARYGFERGDAHTMMNYCEQENRRAFMIGGNSGTLWRAKRAEPIFADWPEITRRGKGANNAH